MSSASRNGLLSEQCTNPTCSGPPLVMMDQVSGDMVCRSCGEVLQSRCVSEEQEWRSFSSSDGSRPGEDRNRVSDKSNHWFAAGEELTTRISGGDQIAKVHMAATNANQDPNHKLVKTAFDNLQVIKVRFSLADRSMERAREIVMQMKKQSVLKGRTTTGWMVAVTYLALQEEGTPRTFKALKQIDPRLTDKDLYQKFNTLVNELGRKGAYSNPADYLPAFCNKCGVPANVEDAARVVLNRAQQYFNKSRKPMTMAASAVYLVSCLTDDPVSLYNLAWAAGKITESTIKSAYKELREHAQRLIPDTFTPSRPFSDLP
eukprot:GHVL01027506.1.p1 GENE.GHVL01027506.1~~GHVL01027506.1.p1  ORF type:complete len:317 (+),score=38.53 GHVL01027506.1:67-1017(+)